MRKPRTTPPSDDVLRHVIENSASFEAAAFRLGVEHSTVQRHAARLGVRTMYRVREGLPSESTLVLEMLFCERFRDVADKYGVEEHLIRNEAKRLGVTAPTKRRVYGPTREVMAPFRAHAGGLRRAPGGRGVHHPEQPHHKEYAVDRHVSPPRPRRRRQRAAVARNERLQLRRRGCPRIPRPSP